MAQLETLGSRLKYIREKQGIKQNYAANKIGIAPSTLAGYESDFRDPDTETLQKLADLYDVSTDWLLSGQEASAIVHNDGEHEDLIELQRKLESGEQFKYKGKPLSDKQRKSLLATIDLILDEQK